MIQSRHSRPSRAEEALAEGVRLWRAGGRLQRREGHRLRHAVNGGGERGIPIVDDVPMAAVEGYTIAELLDCPGRAGICGDIPVHGPTSANVQQDEDVESLKGGRDRQEEVRRERQTAGGLPASARAWSRW